MTAGIVVTDSETDENAAGGTVRVGPDTYGVGWVVVESSSIRFYDIGEPITLEALGHATPIDPVG